MKFKNIFSEITEKLDEIDEQREQILKLTRKMIRNCSVAIKSIHREEIAEYKEKVEKIKEEHRQLKELVSISPESFGNYLKTPEQEYVEAVVLFNILHENEIPSPSEMEVDEVNYLLGLADVIGELRRHVLDKIRLDQTEKVEDYLEKMEKIYTYLFALDYPKGITKDLRHKTDIGRRIIEQTRGDISLSLQINRLNKNLEKK